MIPEGEYQFSEKIMRNKRRQAMQL